jgi:hypothetical protein
MARKAVVTLTVESEDPRVDPSTVIENAVHDM